MKLLILLILGIGLVIFFLQNSAPISLVFWGTIKTPSLPLAVWILLFALAGIVSSLFIQLLSQKPREVTGKGNYPRDAAPYIPEPRPSPSPEQRKPETREEVRNISGTSPSEWETGDDEDWDLEEPPKETTVAKYPTERPPEPEKEQPLQPFPRSPSPYSYVYKQKETIKLPPKKTARETEEIERKDQVYDANYRVISPPDRQYTQPGERPLDEDEEEWV
jgi:hypothetical protein